MKNKFLKYFTIVFCFVCTNTFAEDLSINASEVRLDKININESPNPVIKLANRCSERISLTVRGTFAPHLHLNIAALFMSALNPNAANPPN